MIRMKNVLYVENINYIGTSKQGIKAVNVKDRTQQYFAYEDVDVIVFDNVKSYFSQRLIERCAEHNIALLFCDSKHSPVDLFENIYGQKRRFDVLKKQLQMSTKTKDRLWRKVVIAKVNNQAVCLNMLEKNQEAVDLLKSVVKNVTEGDKHNSEAYAAREYFKALFGNKFKRGRYDDIVNASLNYGYAIVRALIRREIVMHGLEPGIGINHHSEENPFNLSDDVIEAYRPLIDYSVVMNILSKSDQELTIEDRKEIVSILLEKCVVNGKIYRIRDAISVTVNSLLNCILTNSSAGLKLPTFIEGGR